MVVIFPLSVLILSFLVIFPFFFCARPTLTSQTLNLAPINNFSSSCSRYWILPPKSQGEPGLVPMNDDAS